MECIHSCTRPAPKSTLNTLFFTQVGIYIYIYSQNSLKGSSLHTNKNWLHKIGDLLMQVHLNVFWLK